MDDDLLLAALNSIRQFLNIWVGMMQVDKIVDCLLEANFRLREQTRKSPKHLLMLLSELDKCCVLMPVTSERIHSEVAEAMKVRTEILTFTILIFALRHLFLMHIHHHLRCQSFLLSKLRFKKILWNSLTILQLPCGTGTENMETGERNLGMQ